MNLATPYTLPIYSILMTTHYYTGAIQVLYRCYTGAIQVLCIFMIQYKPLHTAVANTAATSAMVCYHIDLAPNILQIITAVVLMLYRLIAKES